VLKNQFFLILLSFNIIFLSVLKIFICTNINIF
jgi:hypothetical protein